MDVVLTTYQTVAIECKGDATAAAAAPAKKKAKSDGGLFGVKWKVGGSPLLTEVSVTHTRNSALSWMRDIQSGT